MASKVCRYDGNEFEINYTILNPRAKESILFLHGWGSNQQIMMQAFGKLLPDMRHIYIDMPGFGKSPNNTVLTTDGYAAIVSGFLAQLGVSPDVIVGHSFGGKVATLLDPPLLVLLSSAGILVPKAMAVRVKIALFKILKPFRLQRLHQFFVSDDAKGMSHEMYETFKNVVNEEFEYNFSKVSGKALLFWGMDDTATPLWSGQKINAMIDDSRLIPMEGDHFFFMQHAKEIAKIINETV